MEVLSNILVGGFEAHLLGLSNQELLRLKPLERLNPGTRQRTLRFNSPARILLLHKASRQPVNLIRRKVLAGNSRQHALCRSVAKKTRSAEARNQRDRHEDANDCQKASQDNLFDWTRGLKKTNHVIGNSKVCERKY